MKKLSISLLVLLLCFLVACSSANTSESSIPPGQPTSGAISIVETPVADLDLVTGQVVYIPAYSDIYSGKNRTIDLTITLSVRNTDFEHAIVITSIRYYDTHGNLVREYLEQPLQLGPMASSHVVIGADDETGGVGANFIVEWGATVSVYEPVIEAVMINTASQQGLSLISPGRVISQTE